MTGERTARLPAPKPAARSPGCPRIDKETLPVGGYPPAANLLSRPGNADRGLGGPWSVPRAIFFYLTSFLFDEMRQD